MSETELPSRTVLIIEHDAGVRNLLGQLVSHWGLTPLLADSESHGLELLGEVEVVALVMSDFLPRAGDRTLYDHLTRRSASPAPPFLCTLASSTGPPGDVMTIGRPFDVEALREAVEYLVGGLACPHRLGSG